MTMMITSSSFNEVVHALKRAAEEMKLDTKLVDTWKGVVKLRRGINFWTLGDIIQIDLISINEVQVVHVEAGADAKGEVGAAVAGIHRKLERQLVEIMRDHLGPTRCKIVP